MPEVLRHPLTWIGALLLLGGALAFHNLAPLATAAGWGGGALPWQAPDPANPTAVLLHAAVLPRVVVALLAGAALGLSGAVLQQVLRNPLAEPATLGISAGAQLALSLGALLAPGLAVAGREWLALGGAGAAMAVVLALNLRSGLSPVNVTLTGLMVSLYCATLSAAVALFHHDMLIGLFLWGAGYLDQSGWGGVQFLAPRLLPLALAAALLARPLGLMRLGDESASGLGLGIVRLRLAALAVGVALAAVTVAAVGVIGFIGLAAPAIARLAGARRVGAQLVAAPVLGALLLAVTDQIVLALPVTYRAFPTGAMTALLGAPLLLALLPRLRGGLSAPLRASRPSKPQGLLRPGLFWPGLCALALASLAMALCLAPWPGFGATVTADAITWGWHWPTPEIMGLRGPRVAAAFAGGGLLALAGLIIQRVTANPMASPEVLGISSGALLGTVAAVLGGGAGAAGQLTGGTIGAAAVLLAMLALSRRAAFGGTRLLLCGVALSSVSGLVMAVLRSLQDPRLGQLLSWMAGSTYHATALQASLALLLLLLALAAVGLWRRWLLLLPLGDGAAAGVGLAPAPARALLVSLAALLTAVATLLAGPLSFAGLMAPHFARLVGLRRPVPQAAAAVLFAGSVMTLSDWAGRTLAWPYQIPAGILASLIGAPLLLFLMLRRS